MIIRKVKNLTTAISMKDIAEEMEVKCDYEHDGKRWYVVKFDCSPYVWIFLNDKLKTEIKKLQL